MTAGSFFTKYGPGGQNFMTPTLIRFEWIVPGSMACELSRGTGLSHQPIFGVSVVDRSGSRHDLSKGGYQSKRDAEWYIAELQEAYTNPERDAEQESERES